MISLNLGHWHYSIATVLLLLAAVFIVAVHSDCAAPPRFNFAELKEEYRNRNDFSVGSTVEYSCRPGYMRVFKSSLQCLKNSQWATTMEFCRAKSCSHPGELENGRLIILTDLAFGATVNFTCEEGYRLIGTAQRKCVLEGSQVTWDKEVPYCQLIPCLPPPDIEHGTHTGTTMEELTYGTSVTYQCDAEKKGQVPFSLVGKASIHCTSMDNVNGQWSGPAPQCKAVQCEQPKVDHGRQVTGYSPIYTYRSSVMFECEHRYTLNGSSVVQCNENNRWDPPLPNCERSSCDDPPVILNTFQNHSQSTLFPAGTVVTYNCGRGYELIPGISSPSVICQNDFTWSKHQTFCQKVQCPYPNIPNGKVAYFTVKVKYEYEDNIRVECNPGYGLKDPERQFRCKATGEWDPPLPDCEPACQTPKSIFNGRHDGRRNIFLVGERVTYSCHDGWSLVGVSTIKCIAGDRGRPHWDAPAPECKACWAPKFIFNGRHDGRGNIFLVGERVTYSCDNGWSLVGTSTIKCIAGDRGRPHWDAPAPECKEILCPGPHIENGKFQIEGYSTNSFGLTKYKLGVTVSFTCNPGLHLKGSRSSKCSDKGTWDSPFPVCTIERCSSPPTVDNADPDEQGEFRVGTKVTYSCIAGYELIPGVIPTVTCLQNLEWSNITKICQKVSCPNPVITNGKLIPALETDSVFGRVVDFQCNSGYTLKGSKSIECKANGTWHPPVPSCVQVECPKPDMQNGELVNALDEKKQYHFNESVAFRCSPGYQFSDLWYRLTTDSANITCSANGSWTVLPECKKQSNAPVCKMARETIKILRCGISLTELTTLLEVQKLYLEIQKLKRDLQKHSF